MTDLYRAPAANVLQPPDPAVARRIRWARIVVWSVVVYAAANAFAFATGVAMGNWEIFGDTIEAAIENARLVRRIGYWVISALVVWRFAAALPGRRLLHGALLFVFMQAWDFVGSLLLGGAPGDWFNPGWLGRSATAVAVGLVLASVTSRFDARRRTVNSEH